MTIYTEMFEAGLVVGHHYTDMFVKDVPEAWAIYEKFKDKISMPVRFKSNFEGEGWLLDFALCYDPEWERLNKK